MPAGIMRRPVKHRRNRKMNLEANKPQPATPIGVSSTSKAINTVTVTFDQPVTLKGVPAWVTNTTTPGTAVAAIKTAPNIVAVTFTAAVGSGTAITYPFRDPAIRNASGGFVCVTSKGI